LGLAAVVTIGIYLYSPNEGGSKEFWEDWNNFIAIGVGVAVALIGAILFAVLRRDHALPEATNPRQHGQLSEYTTSLRARLNHFCDCTPGAYKPRVQVRNPLLAAQAAGACAEACAQCEVLERELGMTEATPGRPRTRGANWVLATGFVGLWVRLHLAVAALFVVASKEEVVAEGLVDEERLMGSPIASRDEFLGKLRRAVSILGGRGFLSAAVAGTLAAIEEAKDEAERVSREAQAHLALRSVRNAIDEFRDGRRDGLVRSRNQLLWAGLVTGVVSYSLLALALVVRVEQADLLAAITYFLVAAVIGLFDQLRISAASQTVGEDFGLARTRLVYTPVLSGLAGIGGVVFIAMLYATTSGSMLKYTVPTAVPTATATATGGVPGSPTASGSEGIRLVANGEASYLAWHPAPFQTGATATPTPTPTSVNAVPAEVEFRPPPLSAIFDLDVNGFGLVIAAVFGLTPSLLVNRLQSQADQYKVDLQSTSVQTRGD
jgi:hypothetical protein